MKYEDIINSLPKSLRKHVGGDQRLTEKMWARGYFRLLPISVGDKVRVKGTTGWEEVIAVLPDGTRFTTKEDSDWWAVPWSSGWEKQNHN